MIRTNRLFKRQEPSRKAKSLYIFCEGREREFQYFYYFKKMDSRINLEIYKLGSEENNSPLGLLDNAKRCIIKSEENPKPKYLFQKNDEVWIVLDIDKDKADSRKPQINEVIEHCKINPHWFIAQSNPCFEVWLYYHKFEKKANFPKIGKCKNWKPFLNKKLPGGFDFRKHPIYLKEAITNAEKHYQTIENTPTVGSTDVYKLFKSIYPLIESKIEKIRQDLDL